ncbi:MAG: non-canonical purine NTP pyrophosphatase [Puniceicoccales bacterium]|jgi:XTP/dITP diphosphohydrolase|nr:non-canonical purine NTP pyrophosphatase [Puniceicoccales bacterium]
MPIATKHGIKDTKHLVLATRNKHKIVEFFRLFKLHCPDVILTDAAALGGMPDIREDAGSFLGNARLKARALQSFLHTKVPIWAFSDDSGLCCDALKGLPGVDTANFAGLKATDSANRAKLLKELRDVPDEKRTAHFICQLVLLASDGVEYSFSGICHGSILREESGDGGFGYDSIFQADGTNCSFAVLPPEEKDAISHRGRAVASFAAWLAEQEVAREVG